MKSARKPEWLPKPNSWAPCSWLGGGTTRLAWVVSTRRNSHYGSGWGVHVLCIRSAEFDSVLIRLDYWIDASYFNPGA